MSPTEDADTLALGAATPDDAENVLDAMPIPELASMWGALQRSSRHDQTSAAWAALMYFNRLSKRRPDRAFDLALEVLRAEADNPTVIRLNGAFMRALVYAHGPEMIGRIEQEAVMNERFRNLLGGVWRCSASDEFKARLDALVRQAAGEKLLKPC